MNSNSPWHTTIFQAGDWFIRNRVPPIGGVQPQISVPMDLATQEKVLLEQEAQETFRRPMPKTVTRPTTDQASSQPAAQPMDDVQLQAAINTMLGVLVFETHPPVTDGIPVTATQATSAPAK